MTSLAINGTSSSDAVTLSKSTGGAAYTLALPAAAPAANTYLKYTGTNYAWGAGANIAAQYVFAYQDADKTIVSVDPNPGLTYWTFPFNIIYNVGDVIITNKSTTSTTFTLPAGGTYKCTFEVGTANSLIYYGWVEIDQGNRQVGSWAGYGSPQYSHSKAIHYRTTTTTPVTIGVVFARGNGVTVFYNNGSFGPTYTYALIEVLSNNTAISQFTGATSAADGVIGYIPKPLAGQHNYVLTGGGGWQVGTPPGAVINYAGNTPPPGYLVCNGSLVSRVTYADLFAAIGTLYGAGNGSTTFAVPDLRGQFIRGLDSGANVDAGRVLGSVQMDSLQQHGHVLYKGDGGGAGNAPLASGPNSDDSNGGDKIDGGFPDIPFVREIHPGNIGGGVPRVSGETRPKNVAMIMCIKT